MSIELTTAEQEVLSRIGATLSPPVLTELPEADAEKAGEQFWLNGTLWTYNKEGQFGTLAEGEPWPVKGYKEWTGRITLPASDGEVDIFYTQINDVIVTPTITASTGRIEFVYPSILFSEFGMGTFIAPAVIRAGSGTIYTLGKFNFNPIIISTGFPDNFLAVVFAVRDTSFTQTNVDTLENVEISFKLYPPTN